MKSRPTSFAVAIAFALSLAAAMAAAPATPRGGLVNPPRPVRGELEIWLAQHRAIQDRIAWVTGDGARQEFANWTPAQRARIELFYQHLVAQDRDLGMHLPDADKARGYFTSDMAFDIFAAHVAHVVYVDAHNLVPWQIDKLPADEIDELVCSVNYFAMINPSSATLPAGIQARRDLQDLTENNGLEEYLSDPRIGYEFLSGKTTVKGTNLIGKDPLDTLKNMTIWLRDNVDHAEIDGKNGDRAKQLHWLDERLRKFPGKQQAIANIGCHSAAKLMVDLARSVNIPLLHCRSLDASSGEDKVNFLSRTHGSLVFAWAEANPRIIWHIDDAYAREGMICFPIDDKTGALLPKAQADQLYFDTCWLSPADWAKAGFVYDIQRVYPNKGVGHDSTVPNEQRYDYGLTDGQWKGTGKAHLDRMFEWYQDYVLCGAPLLDLAAKKVVTGQLQADLPGWQGSLKASDLPKMPSWDEFEKRAAAGLKAVGGPSRLAQLEKQAEAQRGNNLLKPGVTYDGRRN
jgi:hypothetical protein